jgi:hypothetical protein
LVNNQRNSETEPPASWQRLPGGILTDGYWDFNR